MAAKHHDGKHPAPRITVGGPDCTQPYEASFFNISAMSFGALSDNAIRALNKGAAIGGFYHNTGEGGVSDYHLENGGDIVWQVGTGYFGCRDKDGNFAPEAFQKVAQKDVVKMIEIKLSQGAKPGHGGYYLLIKILTRLPEFGLLNPAPSRSRRRRIALYDTPIEMSALC
ncbi:glutamate synthase-related protein [Paraglaciecola sp. Hal342]